MAQWITPWSKRARDEKGLGGRGAKGTGWATHPVLALGVHEAGLEHVQGLAQECGTSALGRVSGDQQLRLMEETQVPATAMGHWRDPEPCLGPTPCRKPHGSLCAQPCFIRVLRGSSGSPSLGS